MSVVSAGKGIRYGSGSRYSKFSGHDTLRLGRGLAGQPLVMGPDNSSTSVVLIASCNDATVWDERWRGRTRAEFNHRMRVPSGTVLVPYFSTPGHRHLALTFSLSLSSRWGVHFRPLSSPWVPSHHGTRVTANQLVLYRSGTRARCMSSPGGSGTGTFSPCCCPPP